MRQNNVNRYGKVVMGLAVFVLVLFLIMGGILVANYKNFGNLFKVVSLIKTQYLLPVSTDNLVNGAIRGIVYSLNDPYSVYLEPRVLTLLQEQIRGSFGGLGILVGVREQYLTVIRSYKGTPAAKAGIVAGDKIMKIGEKDARNIDLEVAVGLMRGPIGTKVNLTIKHESKDGLQTVPVLKKVVLVREEIKVPTVEGKVLTDSIGYIVLSQFTEKTPDEMDDVLRMLKNKTIQGIILDLRDNPGGDLKAAIKVACYFISEGPIVYVDYRVGRDDVYYAEPGHAVELPLVVLINEGTASASEIVAGAIKDTRVGILVGVGSFGKGVVQTVFPLSNGAGLKLTTARYLTPARQDINHKGIKPDVFITQQKEATKDLQLEKAMEIMKQLKRHSLTST